MTRDCHCHDIPGLGHCNWVVAVIILALFAGMVFLADRTFR